MLSCTLVGQSWITVLGPRDIQSRIVFCFDTMSLSGPSEMSSKSLPVLNDINSAMMDGRKTSLAQSTI